MANLLGNNQNNTIVGTKANDFIKGYGGNDVLRGQNGHDNLAGGRGSDRLSGGNGNDSLGGGDGTPGAIRWATNFANNKPPTKYIDTISGNDGNDYIISDRYDRARIYGGTGSDRLYAYEGNDTLEGQAGNDKIVDRGNSNDLLLGGDGNDTLFGGAGSDRLHGGHGNDRIYGDGYQNQEYINLNQVAANGGHGQKDILRGDAGNDFIVGSVGSDRISGGDGNDTISGSFFTYSNPGQASGIKQIDILTGGSGKDTFKVNTSSSGLVEYQGSWQYAVITDFDPNQDTIQLSKRFESQYRVEKITIGFEGKQKPVAKVFLTPGEDAIAYVGGNINNFDLDANYVSYI